MKVDDLYTMSPTGLTITMAAGTTKRLIALALSGALSIGLSLLGAYGAMFNVGDWGWLIGAAAGAAVYWALSNYSSRSAVALRPAAH